MIRNKFLVGITLGFVLSTAPYFAFADHNTTHTIQQIQDKINVLMKQIQNLQSGGGGGGSSSGSESVYTPPITTPTPTPIPIPPTPQSSLFCHTFDRNLKIGDRDADVNALQVALSKEGFVTFDGSQGLPEGIGYFGESTAAAVVGFQEKYRSEILTPNSLSRGTGYVGSATRAKLNLLYGCDEQLPPRFPYEVHVQSVSLNNDKKVRFFTTVVSYSSFLGNGYFEYGSTPNFGSRINFLSGAPQTGPIYSVSSNGDIDLLPETTYYYRAVATNQYGTGYSITKSFRTSGSQIQPTPIPTPSLLLGDVNNDGKVTIADSFRIQLHADGTTLLTGQALINGDVTGEGKANGIDALLVANFAAGLITAFPKTDGSSLFLGDANRDGKTNTGDSLVIANHVNGSSKIIGRALDNADVNDDGKITNDDASLVANCVGGTITSFPRGGSCVVATPTTPTIFGMDIKLDSGSPQSKSIMVNSNDNEVARFSFGASVRDIKIDWLSFIIRSGSGSTITSADISSITIFDGSTKVGSAIVPSGEKDYLELKVPLAQNVSIPVNTTKTLSIRVNIPNTAQSNTSFQLSLKSPVGGIDSSGTKYLFSITAGLINGAVHTIVAPTTPTIQVVKVLSPNGGEVYKIGDTLTVQWTPGSPGISQINLVSTTRNYSNSIMATAPNTTGSFLFLIPDNFPLDSYKVKIYRVDAAGGYADESDASFNIISAPVVSLPTSMILGDVNNDGLVTIADSFRIQLHADGASLLTGQALINADVTGEGKANGIDAILVANFTAGLITAFPKTDGSSLFLGDANRDGKTNTGDSLVIANHVNGSSKIIGRALDNADVNDDGKITNDDASLVANCVGGTITSFPRGGSCVAEPKIDLELRSVTAANWLYGFLLNICTNGSKSVNDLEREGVHKVLGYPIHYIVYDASGVGQVFDTSASGILEDYKNGQCFETATTMQNQHRVTYDQNGTVKFVLDYNNLISETNESNNSFIFNKPQPSFIQTTQIPQPNNNFASVIYAMMETLNSISKQLDLLK